MSTICKITFKKEKEKKRKPTIDIENQIYGIPTQARMLHATHKNEKADFLHSTIN